MKKISANATRQTAATPEAAYALLVDLEGYPRWYPDGVSEAEINNRNADGTPTQGKARLKISVGPIQREFKVWTKIVTEPLKLVELSRIPHDDRDRERLTVRWKLAPSGSGTTLTVEIDAELSIPPFMPVGSVAPTIAGGFADAAARALG